MDRWKNLCIWKPIILRRYSRICNLTYTFYSYINIQRRAHTRTARFTHTSSARTHHTRIGDKLRGIDSSVMAILHVNARARRSAPCDRRHQW